MTVSPLMSTLAEGQPVAYDDSVRQIAAHGHGGHLLFTSTQLFEQLAHFARERIPERVVHAKAAGAMGYFELTDDVSDLTDAAFLTGAGKKTDVLVRISTVGPNSGSADTVRDFRGFAIKFKTEEGNQDFVFNNQPVFFVRNPAKFPSLNRSHKRNPATNLPDADMFWDFHINSPESIHALMFLFGDRGLPKSVRHVNAYSGNTYTLTKADGTYHYIRIHIKSDQGVVSLATADAERLAGVDPDNHVHDLQDAIKSGRNPSWTIYFQVMHPHVALSASHDLSIFDMTKVWPHARYPLRRVGRMVLDGNPKNWFTDIEQAAFSPSNMVPGIEASPDIMLQARMFAYPDAARYRLGANYQMLPTNAAKSPVYVPTQRDGCMNFGINYNDTPNYVGASINLVRHSKPRTPNAAGAVSGGHPEEIGTIVTNDDYEQPRSLWCDVMAKQDGAQARFIQNLATNVSAVQSSQLRQKVYELFRKVDEELGQKVCDETERIVQGA